MSSVKCYLIVIWTIIRFLVCIIGYFVSLGYINKYYLKNITSVNILIPYVSVFLSALSVGTCKLFSDVKEEVKKHQRRKNNLV